MALLVTDQGEIDSLRTLLNSTHTIPRNLVLKLYTSNTTPGESDVPSSANYYEPYNASNASGYGSAATTGYPVVANNRTEENQDFTNQYGILLNGNRWTVATTVSAVTTQNATGTSGTYQIAVGDTADIKKGDYAEGAGIPANTYVVDIQGLNLEISQQLTADMTAVATNFGRGRSTASYPEQVFTFTSAAGNVYGYFLSRANNMPTTIHGVADAGTAATGTQISKSGVRGTIGNNYITLAAVAATTASTGTAGEFEVVVTSTTGIVVNQRVTGTNVAQGARVTGIVGTTVYLSKANGGAVSGDLVFQANVAEDLALGMRVSQTTTPNGIDANTVITGIDYETDDTDGTVTVFLNNVLIENIQTSNGNDVVKFDFSKVTATGHGLEPGDAVYIDQGTGNTTTTAGTYIVFETPDANTFTTTKALDGTGSVTLYDAIFFAERFTNGPYAIQNAGDQIKVTLNVSLD